MKTKAQVKMFETIAVLVVFFFLVGFGFIFYTNIKKTSLESELRENAATRAIQIAERSIFLPEIQYSESGIARDSIDLYKLESLPPLVGSNLVYYYNTFGYSILQLDQIYPTKNSWLIYSNPKPGYKTQTSIQFPFSIYDPISDEYSFGVLYVNVTS